MKASFKSLIFLLYTTREKFCIPVLNQVQLTEMEIMQGSLHLLISNTQWLFWSHFRPRDHLQLFYPQELAFWYLPFYLPPQIFPPFLLSAFCGIYPALSLFPAAGSAFSLGFFYPGLLKQDTHPQPLSNVGTSHGKIWHKLFSCLFYPIRNRLTLKTNTDL